MRIVYDNVIFSLQRAGGISLYWSELIKRLVKKNSVFFEKENHNIFRKGINIKIQGESGLPIGLLRYLPFMKKLPRDSIFHSSYYRVSLQKNVFNITTVHDFTYEYFRAGLAKHIHTRQKGLAIKKSDGIICVSESTKNDLLKFYPELEKSKVRVIYNGVGDEFGRLNNPSTFLQGRFECLKDKKYILYVGDRSDYKNFNIVLKILEMLSEYHLVIVGGKVLSKVEIRAIKCGKNRIHHFRGIEGKDLNVLYNNAFCLLYPSSYEGFGIPVAEAMKSGCPVVSTNKSSIPEVVGEAGFLVNNIDTDSFIVEIVKLENSAVRNLLIEKGLLQSQKFNWDKCFEETYAFYEQVAKKKCE